MDRGVQPDLVIAGGGAWAVAPGPMITLALADVLRRPGATQYAFDHARLLGPLGSIADHDERRAVMSDLADDLLIPLGSVVTPAGLRYWPPRCESLSLGISLCVLCTVGFILNSFHHRVHCSGPRVARDKTPNS